MVDEKGVLPDSPAGDEDILNDPDLNDGGDPEGTPEGEPGKGRTIENIYREFARKDAEREERFNAALGQLAEALGRIGAPSKPAEGDGNTLDSMTVDQLKAFRAAGKVPEAQKAAFEDYLLDRMVDEKASRATARMASEMQAKTTRSQFNDQAVQRFPALTDKASPFRRAVDAKLREWGESATTDPRAVLNAANEVAIEQGVQPTVRRAPATPSGSGRPAPRPDSKKTNFVAPEDHKAISKRLQAALPAGKKFDDKRIADRTAEYDEHRNLFIR